MSRDRSNVTALLDEVPSFSRQNRGGIFLVIKGPDRGESVRLEEGGQVAFGSAPTCEMVLTDKTVSRKHLTAELVGDQAATMSKVIDRARFFGILSLAHRGGYVARETVNTPYIPRAAAFGPPYPDGSIAIFVQQRAGIVAGHCGFLFRRNGMTVLRHASQTRGAVIQEPLATYLHRMPSYFLGLKVLMPDARRWEESRGLTGGALKACRW